MMMQAMYLGDDRWKTLTSGGKEFRARNRSGRQPVVDHTYTIQVLQKVVHADGKTTRRKVVLYLA